MRCRGVRRWRRRAPARVSHRRHVGVGHSRARALSRNWTPAGTRSAKIAGTLGSFALVRPAARWAKGPLCVLANFIRPVWPQAMTTLGLIAQAIQHSRLDAPLDGASPGGSARTRLFPKVVKASSSKGR